jgi:hypothetical protein
MIFTTNKPLNEWGKVLHDEDLAAAILDRVLERGRFIRLDGPSGQTRHLKLEDPLPGSAERFRISGKNGSEFPEPTVYRGPGVRLLIREVSDMFSLVSQDSRPIIMAHNSFWGLRCGRRNLAVIGTGRTQL